MIDVPPETQHQQPVPPRDSNSHAIAVTCTQHGAVGFTNLMVSKRDGAIVLRARSARTAPPAHRACVPVEITLTAVNVSSAEICIA